MHLSQANPALIQNYVKELVTIFENDLAQPKKYKIEGQLLDSAKNYLQALKGVQ